MSELLDLKCTKCGDPFQGTKNMKYCPRCRWIKYDYEPDEIIGQTIKCEVCGKDFIKTSANQSICKECQPGRIKQQKAAANAKYIKKAYDPITLRVYKGDKQMYSDHAASQGLSLNQFIVKAMNRQMEEDLSKTEK